VRVQHYESAELQFELAVAAPPASLAGLVRQYTGWIDRSTVPVCLRELPSGHIPLIVYFDGRVGDGDAFTAGLHDTAALVTSAGPAAGVQADMTALGARLLFDRPLAGFRNLTVSLHDLLGPAAARLQQLLHDARTWEARFAVIDREIASRIHAAAPVRREIEWAWSQLASSSGRTRVGGLSRELGWSERHLARQFDTHFGMTPKAFARVLRFGRAVRTLTRDGDSPLADVALDCGYYDQAHFTRDFRDFAGVTPTELLASRRPAESGFSGAP